MDTTTVTRKFVGVFVRFRAPLHPTCTASGAIRRAIGSIGILMRTEKTRKHGIYFYSVMFWLSSLFFVDATMLPYPAEISGSQAAPTQRH
jgi:hypothetical protein